jgi:DNA-binding response OmpR family regulator
MKILVAEDDSVSILVLAARLRKLGHEVVTSENGKDAWFVFARSHPRLVITDVMMPFVDGYELCRKIRAAQRPLYTYIIMLTALGGKENFLDGMNAGADDFLTKPVDPEALAARLRAAERVLALQEEVKQLEDLLPICAYCKRIRDERNEWHGIESYVSDRTEASFSQELCPQCAAVEPR